MATTPKTPLAASTLSAAPEDRRAPTLGTQIDVRVASGQLLLNNETGQRFVDGESTPQTVTVTTLKRLADGDLVQVD